MNCWDWVQEEEELRGRDTKQVLLFTNIVDKPSDVRGLVIYDEPSKANLDDTRNRLEYFKTFKIIPFFLMWICGNGKHITYTSKILETILLACDIVPILTTGSVSKAIVKGIIANNATLAKKILLFTSNKWQEDSSDWFNSFVYGRDQVFVEKNREKGVNSE